MLPGTVSFIIVRDPFERLLSSFKVESDTGQYVIRADDKMAQIHTNTSVMITNFMFSLIFIMILNQDKMVRTHSNTSIMIIKFFSMISILILTITICIVARTRWLKFTQTS